MLHLSARPDMMQFRARTQARPGREMQKLRQLFRRFATPPYTWDDTPLAAESPFYVIGDIHGRDDLLARLLNRIADDSPAPNPRVVCVGDYVDRGEDSAGVLRRLFALSQDPASHVTCLMGNHEDMMLKFLNDPATHGPRWLRNGGLQTVASFGVRQVSQYMDETALKATRDRLRGAMGEALESWLRALGKWQHHRGSRRRGPRARAFGSGPQHPALGSRVVSDHAKDRRQLAGFRPYGRG